MHLRRSFRSTKRLTVRVLTWSAWAASPTVQNFLSIAGRSTGLPLQAVTSFKIQGGMSSRLRHTLLPGLLCSCAVGFYWTRSRTWIQNNVPREANNLSAKRRHGSPSGLTRWVKPTGCGRISSKELIKSLRNSQDDAIGSML